MSGVHDDHDHATSTSDEGQANGKNYDKIYPEKRFHEILHPLLDRHYSTIGIHDVFLSPPPHPLLSAYLNKDHTSRRRIQLSSASSSDDGDKCRTGCDDNSNERTVQKSPFNSWEITGNIKTTPEDFCVREIFSFSSEQQQQQGKENSKNGRTQKIIPGILLNKEEEQKLDGVTIAEILPEDKLPKQSLPANSHHLNTDTPKGEGKNVTKDESRTIEKEGGRESEMSQQFDNTQSQREEVSSKNCTINDDRKRKNRDERVGGNDNTNARKNMDGDKSDGQFLRQSIVSYLLQATSIKNDQTSHVSEAATKASDELIASLTKLQVVAQMRIEQLSTRRETKRNDVADALIPTMNNNSIKNSGDDNESDKVMTSTATETIWIPPLELRSIIPNDHHHAASTSTAQVAELEPKEIRRNFHVAIKTLYPLLKSQSANRHNSSESDKEEFPLQLSQQQQEQQQQQKQQHWIRVDVDTLYDELIPYLECPLHDLQLLYSFQKRGISRDPSTGIDNGGNKRRKRNQQHEVSTLPKLAPAASGHFDGRSVHGVSSSSVSSPAAIAASNGTDHVILRLRPSVSKQDRREIHHILSTKCKLFSTTTLTDYRDDSATPPPHLQSKPSSSGGVDKKSVSLLSSEEGGQPAAESNSELSSNLSSAAEQSSETSSVAVVVSWQRQAMQRGKKRSKQRNNNSNNKEKRKRPDNDSRDNNCSSNGDSNEGKEEENDEQYPNVLFVLHKRQMEHLFALQQLAKMVRCRVTDIGTAGIKDMHAVTYQFCTIRNMTAQQLRQRWNQNRRNTSPLVDSVQTSAPSTTVNATAAPSSSSVIEKRTTSAIELGNFFAVDWVINTGDADGNQFELVVRNVRRIHVAYRNGKHDDDVANQNEGNDASNKTIENQDEKEGYDVQYSKTDIAVEKTVKCTPQHISNMKQRIQQYGFINFFGEQRVGTPGGGRRRERQRQRRLQQTQREEVVQQDDNEDDYDAGNDVGVRSFDIGRAMLQKNYSKAIDLIMSGRSICRRSGDIDDGGGDGGGEKSKNDRESDKIQRVRQVWMSSGGDPHKTMKALGGGNKNGSFILPRERAILKGLIRHGKHRPLAALRCLKFDMRILWINAYQSYIWNHAASQRIAKYGTKVVVGDLYLPKAEEDNDDDAKRGSGGGSSSSGNAHIPPPAAAAGGTRHNVRTVTAENLNDVSLSQVVLPLPGYNIRYPENEMADIYRQLLKENDNEDSTGIKFEKSAVPESTAKGSYRHLIVRPEQFDVEVLSSSSTVGSADVFTATTTAVHATNDDDGNETNGIDIKMKFQLPKGSYATMLLREFMVTTSMR